VRAPVGKTGLGEAETRENKRKVNALRPSSHAANSLQRLFRGSFTHTADQWKGRAWLRPEVKDDRIVFNIIPPRTKAISTRVYGVYHGRFIEMLLCHFDSEFTRAWATATPTTGDSVRGQDASG
jgi:hypothetical protein